MSSVPRILWSAEKRLLTLTPCGSVVCCSTALTDAITAVLFTTVELTAEASYTRKRWS